MRKSRRGPAGPDRFPGFTDITEIGSGGFSTVYRAREQETGRMVALKVLNTGDVLPHALDAFERETRALGAVSHHPNIVTFYRPLRLEDGRPVLVLELCAGSIATDLRSAPLAPPRAVSVAVKIAGALETAHRAEMLHRDVKPQNILLTGLNEPALADFGVARLQASSQATAGVFGFTTLHAPPEILEGQALSPATDVYELASTLYQLLTGRGAFTTFDGESPAAVILRILRDPVPPLVGEGVPVALSDLLVQAMSKDPSARPQRAREFADALRSIEAQAGWTQTAYAVLDPDGTGSIVDAAPAVFPLSAPSDRPHAQHPSDVAPTIVPGAEPSPYERPIPPAALPSFTPPAYTPSGSQPKDPLEVTGLFRSHAAAGGELEATYVPGPARPAPAPEPEPSRDLMRSPLVVGAIGSAITLLVVLVLFLLLR